MLRRDSFLLGLVLGIIFPIAGYAILFFLKVALTSLGVLPEMYSQLRSTNRTIGVLAICFNLLLVQIFNARKFNNAIRGLVFTTMALILIWFLVYGRQLLNQF